MASNRAEINARYRERHPERIRQQKAAYREKNREILRAKGREYSKRRYAEDEEFAEKARERIRALAGSDYLSQIRRRSYEKNAEKRRQQRRSSYRIERKAIYERGRGICHLCKTKVPFDQFEIDHIIPRKLGGTDDQSNLAIAHRSCNRRKSSRFLMSPA